MTAGWVFEGATIPEYDGVDWVQCERAIADGSGSATPRLGAFSGPSSSACTGNRRSADDPWACTAGPGTTGGTVCLWPLVSRGQGCHNAQLSRPRASASVCRDRGTCLVGTAHMARTDSDLYTSSTGSTSRDDPLVHRTAPRRRHGPELYSIWRKRDPLANARRRGELRFSLGPFRPDRRTSRTGHAILGPGYRLLGDGW